jgi:hypothetical protein
MKKKINLFQKKIFYLIIILIMSQVVCAKFKATTTAASLKPPAAISWSDWQIDSDGKSRINLSPVTLKGGNELQLKYQLKGDSNSYVIIRKTFVEKPLENVPLTFLIKANAPSDFEIKFIDSDGSTLLKKIPLAGMYKDWTQIVIYQNNLEYVWGGDDKFSGLSKLEFAISGKGSGTVWLDQIGFGEPSNFHWIIILGAP